MGTHTHQEDRIMATITASITVPAYLSERLAQGQSVLEAPSTF